MISNGLLKLLSVSLLAATIGMLVVESSKSFNWKDIEAFLPDSGRTVGGSDQHEDESVTVDEDGASHHEAIGVSRGEARDALADAPESRLVVGALGAVPTVQQVHAISEVPWLESQVDRAFNQATDFACHLLLPDMAVKPYVSRPPVGRRGVLGRIPAITVGLEVDQDARSKLPQTSRGAIEAYLRDHRLAIEPIIYQDEQGQPYFGTDCRAAFYPISTPTTTIKAEPMIEEAIGRFRALGLLREHPQADGRTLVMAFRYMQSDNSRLEKADKSAEVTELLFLHLTSDSPDRLPNLEVFATSDARQNVHRLMAQSMIAQQSMPIISASVRFDSFVLMGLYPAKPVVTGVRQRANAVMSLETVLKFTQRAEAEDRLTFQQLLDQFTSINGQI